MISRTKRFILQRLHRPRKSRKPLQYPPLLDNNRFLFIGGLHRSGTSILHRLLREHPSTSGFHDTGVAEDEGQHLQSVFPAAHVFGGPGEFALHPGAHLTEDSELINQRNRDRLLMEWGAYYDMTKPVLLEKSPPNLIRSRFLRRLFPGSSFVFIVRHPVAVSLATEKWTSRSLGERMRHWCVAHSIMLEDIDSVEDCIVIRYEDLVREPSRYLNRICDLAGIERFSATQGVEDHNEKYLRQWRLRHQTESDELRASLDSCNALLDHFGYALGSPYVRAT